MHPPATGETEVKPRSVGGPTLILELAALRLLTDPGLDSPVQYDTGLDYKLTKTERPSLGLDDVGLVDVVLLSHGHYADNLDTSGFLRRCGSVLADALGDAHGSKV